VRAECGVCPTRARACQTHTDTRVGVSDTHRHSCGRVRHTRGGVPVRGRMPGLDAQRVDDARAVPRKWDEVVRSLQEAVQRARLGEP